MPVSGWPWGLPDWSIVHKLQWIWDCRLSTLGPCLVVIWILRLALILAFTLDLTTRRSNLSVLMDLNWTFAEYGRSVPHASFCCRRPQATLTCSCFQGLPSGNSRWSKIDRAETSRQSIGDWFLGVVWAVGRPDLGPTLLLFEPMSAFEWLQCELLSSELVNSTSSVSATFTRELGRLGNQ